MISIQPQQVFPIVRQLNNPGDVSGYYVQAVVRNARSGAVLQTINLTDNGSGRFTGTYTPGADTSGLGYYIDVTTLVYTDAGYSVPSGNYGTVSDTYQVYDQISSRNGGGGVVVGGGGASVSEIEAVVKKYFDTLEKPEKVDFTALSSSLEDLHAKVDAIDIPEPEKMDMEPHVKTMKDHMDAVKQDMRGGLIEVAKMIADKPHMTPETAAEMMHHLKSIRETVEDKTQYDRMTKSIEAIQSLKEELTSLFNDQMPEVNKILEHMVTRIREAAYHMIQTEAIISKRSPKLPDNAIKGGDLLG